MRTAFSATHLIAAGVIVGAFAIGFMSGPALADESEPAEPFAFKFEYAHSELASSEGAERMLARLERKVERECGAHDRMPVAERRLVKTCIDETMGKTVERFGSSTLAQAYRTRTGG